MVHKTSNAILTKITIFSKKHEQFSCINEYILLQCLKINSIFFAAHKAIIIVFLGNIYAYYCRQIYFLIQLITIEVPTPRSRIIPLQMIHFSFTRQTLYKIKPRYHKVFLRQTYYKILLQYHKIFAGRTFYKIMTVMINSRWLRTQCARGAIGAWTAPSPRSLLWT